ncbi:FH1/FH2 domain-containing protein 3-like [Erpetoichthys calabaricus]|uniref:FH1/FH2 domain-containing protein 3-like n=1 Tax=Erpetoichthys calabaricus TaxID=27687 RepID=UPI0022347948|nr:FH1/FH2 domain-containing protein 3-like [Erpetoichthys calabaricus]
MKQGVWRQLRLRRFDFSTLDHRADLDQAWDLLLKNVPQLQLNALDFSDLWEDESVEVESDERSLVGSAGCEKLEEVDASTPPSPPPPPPPPPPLPESGACPLPGLDNCTGLSTKQSTIRLHWNELLSLPLLPTVSHFGQQTIWARLEPVNVDAHKLEYFFKSKPGGLGAFKSKGGGGAQMFLNVLDLRRSNIINIALSSLPAPHIIREAVLKMDECVLDREDIQRMMVLIPSEEEMSLIKEAKKKNPSLPLGSAEHCLLTMGSVPDLQERLDLWTFKMDYDSLEREIAESLFNLKIAMEQLASNKTFRFILATVLAIGNFLNGCKAKGFELGYLAKLPQVRDTVHRKTLLHHTCSILLDLFPQSTDLHSEVTAVTKCAKVDFSQVLTNLEQLEARCKASAGQLKVISKREMESALKCRLKSFIKDSAHRVNILRAVYRRVTNRFHSFLLFLGYPKSTVRELHAETFCKIVSDFALEYRTARAHIIQLREKQNEKQGSCASPVCQRNESSDELKQHECMKEILSTPEMTRRLDNSLPRPRYKKDGKGPTPQKIQRPM